MRVAAIDLGSNTFILLVADVKNGRIQKVLCDEVKVVRLGQGVHQSRRFHPEALARAGQCLGEFRKLILDFGAEKILAVATSAARDVTNGKELINLGAKHGVPIEIISGGREAELTYWGTLDADPEGPVLIIDIGGGSTEYILGDLSGLVARQSLDIGSVRLTELFVTQHPVSEPELRSMTEYIQTQLKGMNVRLPAGGAGQGVSRGAGHIIAVAGTPTTLAAIDMGQPFDAQVVNGYTLTSTRLQHWVRRLSRMTVAERQALSGMDAKRADVIVAGALILLLSCQDLGATAIKVSTRGLRYGLARNLF